jgi:hypothetical protein
MKRTSYLILVSTVKASPNTYGYSQMNMLGFPMLAGGKKKRKRGAGESIHPSTPA